MHTINACSTLPQRLRTRLPHHFALPLLHLRARRFVLLPLTRRLLEVALGIPGVHGGGLADVFAVVEAFGEEVEGAGQGLGLLDDLLVGFAVVDAAAVGEGVGEVGEGGDVLWWC